MTQFKIGDRIQSLINPNKLIFEITHYDENRKLYFLKLLFDAFDFVYQVTDTHLTSENYKLFKFNVGDKVYFKDQKLQSGTIEYIYTDINFYTEEKAIVYWDNDKRYSVNTSMLTPAMQFKYNLDNMVTFSTINDLLSGIITKRLINQDTMMPMYVIEKTYKYNNLILTKQFLVEETMIKEIIHVIETKMHSYNNLKIIDET